MREWKAVSEEDTAVLFQPRGFWSAELIPDESEGKAGPKEGKSQLASGCRERVDGDAQPEHG